MPTWRCCNITANLGENIEASDLDVVEMQFLHSNSSTMKTGDREAWVEHWQWLCILRSRQAFAALKMLSLAAALTLVLGSGCNLLHFRNTQQSAGRPAQLHNNGSSHCLEWFRRAGLIRSSWFFIRPHGSSDRLSCFSWGFHNLIVKGCPDLRATARPNRAGMSSGGSSNHTPRTTLTSLAPGTKRLRSNGICFEGPMSMWSQN